MLTYLPGVVTLKLDTEKCIGCGRCETVCPHAVFSVEAGTARIGERDACMECGACARNCPVGAITVRPGVGCAAGMLFGGDCACDCAEEEEGGCCS